MKEIIGKLYKSFSIAQTFRFMGTALIQFGSCKFHCNSISYISLYILFIEWRLKNVLNERNVLGFQNG